MNTLDITIMETSLGVKLPEVYKRWLLTLPAAGPDYRWSDFFNNKDVIIYNNKMFRASGLDGQPWCSSLFCIGGTDDDYAFVHLPELETIDTTPFPIYCTDHDNGLVYTAANWRNCLITYSVPFFE